MNDNTAALLKELAAKLGTTVEHVYAVLLKQVPIWILRDILCALLWWAAMAALQYFGVRLWRRSGEDRWSDPFISERACAVLFFMISCVFCAVAVDFSISAVTGFLNPEFSVLTYIVDRVR